MNDLQVLQRAASLIEASPYRASCPTPTPQNFLRYTAFVADLLRHTRTAEQLQAESEFIVGLKRLNDDFEVRRAYDPGILYAPMNPKAAAFHSSTAFIRFFKAGNRTSKTTSGYIEDYLVATGQPRYRKFPAQMNSVFIVGLEYSKYAPLVFEPKMLTGEQDNILSPLFPEQGKWFYHYDQKTRQITLRCQECAETREPGICAGHHKKGYITLFSDEGGSDVIEGFTGQHGHIDEMVAESFFGASKTRLMATRDGTMAITCTPRYGPLAWQKLQVEDIANGPADKNVFYSEYYGQMTQAEMFYCSMWEANVMPKAKVAAYAGGLKEWERLARVEGKDMPAAENPVFDLGIIYEDKQKTKAPEHVELLPKEGVELPYLSDPSDVVVVDNANSDSGWSIWERPVKGALYVMGIDTAAGLAKGDYSCTQILRAVMDARGELSGRQVAKFHKRLPTGDYADQVKLGGTWYNGALAVVETTGIGRAVLERLKRQIYYANLFRDMAAPSIAVGDVDSRLGMDTNYATKPAMVGVTQQAHEKRKLYIADSYTLDEMASFEQERTQLGIQTRYRGAHGTKDDAVMAIILASYALFTQPIFDLNYLMEVQKDEEKTIQAPAKQSDKPAGRTLILDFQSDQSPFD